MGLAAGQSILRSPRPYEIRTRSIATVLPRSFGEDTRVHLFHCLWCPPIGQYTKVIFGARDGKGRLSFHLSIVGDDRARLVHVGH